MTLSTRILALLLTAFILTTSGVAQESGFQDPLLDHLVGKWVIRGTVMGEPTIHDADAGWVMEHRYLSIHEVSRDRTKDGKPKYEATVFVGWNPKSSQYGCVWLDTFGGITPISLGTATRDGDKIPFLFKDGEERFHNTFIYHPERDSWDWRMDDENKGILRPFARFTLTRAR